MKTETIEKLATIDRQLTLIDELRDYDHGFLSAVGVRYFLQPFGIEGGYSAHTANPDEPKGLTLDDGATDAIGQDAAVVAELIAEKLGCPPSGKMGRSFRLRAALDAAAYVLQQQQAELEPEPEVVEPEDQSQGDPECERGA